MVELFESRYTIIIGLGCFGGENARRKTCRSRSKKETRSFEKLLTIRLPRWMISQLKNKCEIGYLIEDQLAKIDFLDIPDYDIDN